MAEPDQPGRGDASTHARWVRLSHWIVTASVLALAFSGFEILMVHPRLYWGKAGNDLTPALVELPISRNYKHNGYDARVPLCLYGPQFRGGQFEQTIEAVDFAPTLARALGVALPSSSTGRVLGEALAE